MPTDFSARIARNTQLILQEESGICEAIDAFGGSEYLEKTTTELKEKALKIIEEIEKIGGMTQAINAGIPQRMIEDSAAKRQANIDSNNELIIGLNSHYSNEKYEFDILQINNEEVRKNQLSRLHKVRSSRDHAKVEKNLEALTEAAKNNTGNLLALSIEAARNRATLGEISFALEKSPGHIYSICPLARKGSTQIIIKGLLHLVLIRCSKIYFSISIHFFIFCNIINGHPKLQRPIFLFPNKRAKILSFIIGENFLLLNFAYKQIRLFIIAR